MKIRCPNCNSEYIFTKEKSVINESVKNSKNYFLIKCKACGYEDDGMTLAAAIKNFRSGRKIKEVDSNNLLSALGRLKETGLDKDGLVGAMSKIKSDKKESFIWEKNLI